MSQLTRLQLAYKALVQLGPRQTGLFALYQLGLRTGHFQRTLTRASRKLVELNQGQALDIQPCLAGLPNRNDLLNLLGDKVDLLYREAEEVINGSVRLFGGQPVPLNLTPYQSPAYWTDYERINDQDSRVDIKYIWEPGRFGWACKLAMAYHLSQDERYSEAFWLFTECFLSGNPPYNGPHWSSAQEVAIRLIVLSFALQAFTGSAYTTTKRLDDIARAIAYHAERIPATLVYARAQNNNHLVTEALGLFTASALLPKHPLAPRWHRMGWKWLLQAFRTQISADGTYTQHSTNYHRMLLQAAVWAYLVHHQSFSHENFPAEILDQLQASTKWLWKLVDPQTGRVPNLGHNDGAYFLPLTVCPYDDYRPVLQAASLAFLDARMVPAGPWDDLAHWSSLPMDRPEVGLNFWHQVPAHVELHTLPPHVHLNQINGSWGMLRVAEFTDRPAHVDQLHLDLWWRGYNLAMDPGTYLYNAPPPWENGLASAFVHNTVVVDDQEFMQRAGRFRYLDWAQARIVATDLPADRISESLSAWHNGYRKMGITHTRKVAAHTDGHWEILDRLDGSSTKIHTARVHWLLPDWEYELQVPNFDLDRPACLLHVKSPLGWVTLTIDSPVPTGKFPPKQAMGFQLIRAGSLLAGSGTALPINGWTSPTYGDKIPALACILTLTSRLPIELRSVWTLPDES